ncbi:MAG: CRTAC1 family protein [Marinicellaceae bacterium]
MREKSIFNKKNTVVLITLLISTAPLYAQTFKEISNSLGVNFVHQDARVGEYQFTETAGSGLGWLDYNNDGNLDLLIVNGIKEGNVLYKNTGSGFENVTQSVLKQRNIGRGMGICSADLNQDGWIDFLITNYGNDVLYLNNSGKYFTRKNLDSKPQTYQWSTSCSFADLDNDGDLDLYVGRYAQFKLSSNKACQKTQAKGYCNPTDYKGETDGLYINDGKANFTNLTLKRGINNGINDRGFGVVISDYDHDNDMDIFVANDGTENRLYINDGKGYFKDNGLYSGTAINQNGLTESGMGVALADINQDGYQDIFITHYSMETNTLYQNYGEGNFSDMTHVYGMNQTSYMSMGWGTSFVDINNNGYDDLIVANGHLINYIKKIDDRQTYGQVNHIYLNQKGKAFTLQNHKESFSTEIKKSSRGLATADWNNDGKIDFAVNNIVDEFKMYKNTDENSNNWIGINLIGNKINSSAIGAVVTLKTENMSQRKEVFSGVSYMSQSDLRLIFGLGDFKQAVEFMVKWPDGKESKHTISELNKYHTLNYPK